MFLLKKETYFKFFLFIFLFVYLSSLVIKGIGFISRDLWVLILLLFFLRQITKEKSIIFIDFRWFLFFYCLFIIWAGLNYVFSLQSINNLVPYITYLILFLSLVYLIKFLIKKLGKDKLFSFILCIYLIHAILIVASFLLPGLKIYLNILFPFEGNIDITAVRVRGILSAEGATVALFLTFGFFIIFWKLLKHRAVSLNLYSYMFILFLGVLFSGRTGLLIISIYLIMIFVFLTPKLKPRKTIVKFYSLMPFIAGFFILLFIYIYNKIKTFTPLNTAWGADALQSILKWVMKEKSSESSTINILLSKHLIINNNFWGLLFGDPNFLTFGNSTDIGYLRKINDFGLIGAFLYYFSIFILFFKTFHISKGFERYLVFILTIVMFLSEFKEPFMYKLVIAPSYLTLLLIIYFSNKDLHRKINPCTLLT